MIAAKTTTCANLGIGLAREGKRVLLVDCDPQASLTLSLGWRKLESLSVTLATLMGRVLQEQPVHAEEAILHHAEGVDLIPGSIALSGMEASLNTRQSSTDFSSMFLALLFMLNHLFRQRIVRLRDLALRIIREDAFPSWWIAICSVRSCCRVNVHLPIK